MTGRPHHLEVDLARRGRARAEFLEWAAVLSAHERGCAAVDGSDAYALSREWGRREVTAEIAADLGVSEQAVWGMVHDATVLRDRLPRTWEAFAAGDIDRVDALAIADTADRLRTTRAAELLDANGVDYAIAHTPAQLRAWLRRFRITAEPDHARTETAAAIAGRRVAVTYQDDGTSWLSALLPTGVAIAVAGRLRRAAKALPAVDPDTGEKDRRTRDQKQADLVAHWLASCSGTETDIRAEIAIAIDATDLIGLTDGPAVVRGDGEPLAAEWVRELATSTSTTLRRLVLDPLGQVLDTTSIRYRPTDTLRQALHWRDGTCRVATCSAPVFATDLDHEAPWHVSHDTSASNLRCLCRKHHTMKGHGHLRPELLDGPARYRERWHPPGAVVYELDLCPAA